MLLLNLCASICYFFFFATSSVTLISFDLFVCAKNHREKRNESSIFWVYMCVCVWLWIYRFKTETSTSAIVYFSPFFSAASCSFVLFSVSFLFVFCFSRFFSMQIFRWMLGCFSLHFYFAFNFEKMGRHSVPITLKSNTINTNHTATGKQSFETVKSKIIIL